jgi:membrane glycosyltransferase
LSLDPTFANASPAVGAQPVEFTPTGTQSTVLLTWRRRIFSALSVLTLAAMTSWLAEVFTMSGFDLLDGVMLVCFLVCAPWFVIGFWNSVIGFGVLQLAKDPLNVVNPAAVRARIDDPIFVRTAILMTVRNENPARAFKRMRAVKTSLDVTGLGNHFDYYILSDSSEPAVIEAEQAAFAAWFSEFPDPERLIYRHRAENAGFKAGNVRDFCERWGKKYEIMVPLDADSLMTGSAIVRLVQIMQANPRLGILQSLVVGMPSPSFFARVFQFGMRHGMRSFTTGSAWWHADCGPFWGHNAAVRIAPFTDYCKLPDLPGKPPFGGHILSHDQIEAVLMRRAGYEVRVLTEEDGSYEENPPALPDFVQRDTRWCQGNLQYLKLVNLPALLPISRMQIVMAIQMFLVSPAIILFVIAAALSAALFSNEALFPKNQAILFYLVFILMYLSPKLLGVSQALLHAPRRYGGAVRILVGTVVETVFTFMIVPISMFNQTMFMLALLFGRNIGWASQQRDGYRVSWRAAVEDLWPATSFGTAILIFIAFAAPAAILWFLPFLMGLILSIPFAVFTSSPEVGEAAVQWRLCAIPEEFTTPAEISTLLTPPATVQ